MMVTTLIRPDIARAELAKRELARRHLVDFSQYVSPWYAPARHHRYLGEHLEQVERYIATKGREGIGRLMVFEPPRHGKTEQVSKHFPAWLLGRLPDSRIILTSYGSSLADDNSRAVRELLKGERYRAIFGDRGTNLTPQPPSRGGKGEIGPVQLSSDSRSVQAWDLAGPHRGGMVSAGVGGGITGKGANLLVIDDPFKNREESESETHREKVWDWYRSSAYTRLEQGGAIVLMHTRWHTADLAGILLDTMKDGTGDEWTVVRLPAIAEEADPLGREAGEALWPMKYSEEDLARIRANLGEYDWEALYQQEPFSRSGNMFRREWFVVGDDLTHLTPGPFPGREGENYIVDRVRYWDIATTAGGGAYTAGVLMGRSASGIIYVEHVVRGQWGEYERDQQMLHTAQIDSERPGPRTVIWHEQEPGSSGKDAAAARNMKMAEAGFEAHFETVTGDKVVRAGPWSSALEAGKVRLVRGGWNQAYIDEHCSFPKGRYKDQVDASDGAFAKVSQGYSPNGGIYV